LRAPNLFDEMVILLPHVLGPISYSEREREREREREFICILCVCFKLCINTHKHTQSGLGTPLPLSPDECDDTEFVTLCVCVYYCRTFYKAVRVGEEESGGHVL